MHGQQNLKICELSGSRRGRLYPLEKRPPVSTGCVGLKAAQTFWRTGKFFALPFQSNISATDGSQIYIARSAGSWPGHCTD